MKFIHCADLHLDSRMQTNLTATQARQRKLEILNTFERMVAFAKAHDVTAIIIAGDMFDTGLIQDQTKKRVINTIVSHPEIDFLYLSGNHDETNFITALESRPRNLKLFGNDWTTYRYGQINFIGRIMQSNLSSSVPVMSANDVNIMVLHGELSPSEIDLRYYSNKNLDYLALGHIHTYQQGRIDERGIYCYAGCLEGRGFDECGEKGFVLLNIEIGQKISTEFIPFAERQFIELREDVTGVVDWFKFESNVLAKTANISHKNFLKIIIYGQFELGFEKQLDMLQKKLAAFYAVKIKDESTLHISATDFANDPSLRGEFVRTVLSANLSPEILDQTLAVGLKALTGERL